MHVEPRSLARVVPLALALTGLGCHGEPKQVRVAAAADLKDAFTAIGARFEAKSGKKVSFTFGSTGLLTKQLKEGAPFDLFAAANVSYVDEVVSSGACDGATKAPYARGRLAIWTPSKDGGPKTLADLADPRYQRIAIANPEHAPYGKAAQQALERAGAWDRVSDRIIKGENVQATLALATSGNADAAIVAYSLVVHMTDGSYVLVDADQHDAIDQALVVCTHGVERDGGEQFAAFVASDEGRAIMQSYGFTLPGEPAAPKP